MFVMAEGPEDLLRQWCPHRLTRGHRTLTLQAMSATRTLLLCLLFRSAEARSQGVRDSLLGVWNNTALPDTQRLAAHRSVWRVYLHLSLIHI